MTFRRQSDDDIEIVVFEIVESLGLSLTQIKPDFVQNHIDERITFTRTHTCGGTDRAIASAMGDLIAFMPQTNSTALGVTLAGFGSISSAMAGSIRASAARRPA